MTTARVLITARQCQVVDDMELVDESTTGMVWQYIWVQFSHADLAKAETSASVEGATSITYNISDLKILVRWGIS